MKGMDDSGFIRLRLDRRTFLKHASSASLAGLALPLASCIRDGTTKSEELSDGAIAGSAVVRTINRPILIPWSDNTVRILDTTSALPLAYVSLGLRRVYVENMVRDQVIGLLNAHVSVSTGLWRIPLPGDRPEQPLIPGDTSREFEVAEIWDWDPKADPTEGDFRIMAGAGVRTNIHFSCQPISGKEEWYSAGPWSVDQCDPSLDGACREDFQQVGEGIRYTDRNCSRPGETVGFLTWVCGGPPIDLVTSP